MTIIRGTKEFEDKAKFFRREIRTYFDAQSLELIQPNSADFNTNARQFLPMDNDVLNEYSSYWCGKREFARLFTILLTDDTVEWNKPGYATVIVDQSDINPSGTFENVAIWITSFTSNFDPLWQLYKRWYYDWEDYETFEASFPNEIVVT